ncbi:hypothetical protein AKJ37_04190 [candidate division MSBL1 archaeon SCGC-AAA259I09]|uniref:Alpha-galactosidase NEW3 domain-containing protein n=1 Tax=candidate division MSBL1 archaeon SCGC-AAA259I09 TaxID=1698267 RepID=A0A133URY5_9EURY|nr:hypothetical protein AKJ37_04190 [candidate division MSBL1 archaeon SCGC-AAA259I09]
MDGKWTNTSYRSVKMKKTAITLFGLILILGLTVPHVYADSSGEVSMTTPFPHVVIGSGESVDRKITIHNPSSSSKLVNFSISTANDNWSASLRESGVEVKSAYLQAGGESNLTLRISPPTDTKEGTYPVEVKALNQEETVLDTLEILVDVEPSAVTGIEVQTKYPKMEGPPGKKMEFTIDVTNHGDRKTINYGVNVQGQEGWKTNISPRFEDKSINSQSFEAGEEKTINLTVTPPETVKPDDYKVDFVASSGAVKDNLSLIVSIPGTYKLDLTTKTGRLNTKIERGSTGTVQLVVRNRGSAPLKNIQLSTGYNLPSGWSTEFNPETVPVIEPKSQQTVELTVETADDTVPGDYSFEIRANATEPYDRTASFDLRVTVSPGTSWGFVGIGIIGIILAGLFLMFWRFGRR